MSNLIEVYQPPVKGYHCKDCGAKVMCRTKSRLCRKCNARRLGLRSGGRNKGKKRGDVK